MNYRDINELSIYRLNKILRAVFEKIPIFDISSSIKYPYFRVQSKNEKKRLGVITNNPRYQIWTLLAHQFSRYIERQTYIHTHIHFFQITLLVSRGDKTSRSVEISESNFCTKTTLSLLLRRSKVKIELIYLYTLMCLYQKKA